jgi:hypothetical protein
MTPRERAEAVVEKMGGEVGPDKVFWPETWRRTIETAITEHIRALLADEATIELMADRLGDWLQPRLRALDAARAVLAALRGKAFAQ